MSVALNLTRWTSCTASLESHSTRYAVTRAPPSSTGGVHVTFSDPSPSGLMATVRGGDGAARGGERDADGGKRVESHGASSRRRCWDRGAFSVFHERRGRGR